MPLWLIYVAGKNKTYLRLQDKCPIFCRILNKRGFCRQIFIRVSNTKFSENPLCASGADICGQATNIMKYANALKNDGNMKYLENQASFYSTFSLNCTVCFLHLPMITDVQSSRLKLVQFCAEM